MKQEREENSSRKIYYLFAFLFGWYGLSWFFFPKILRRINASGMGSQITFFENLSFVLLPAFMALAIFLVSIGFYLDKKKGVDEGP